MITSIVSKNKVSLPKPHKGLRVTDVSRTKGWTHTRTDRQTENKIQSWHDAVVADGEYNHGTLQC